jgi:anti-sigma B factor antagonist
MADRPDSDAEPEAPDSPSIASFRVDAGPPVVVHVGGELDADSSPELSQLIDDAFAAGATQVAVDLTELSFIDSVGLSVLVAGHNRGRSDGVAFEVRNLPSGPRRIFEITGLLEVLDLR